MPTYKIPMVLSSAAVRAEIDKACLANDVPELSRAISFTYSRRLTRSAGIAHIKHNTITLSLPIMARMPFSEQVDTVIHEACHLIVTAKEKATYGRLWSPAHGTPWKVAMMRAGVVNPRRCHDVDIPELRRKQEGSEDFVCGCEGKIHTLGRVRAARAKANHRAYWCKKCKHHLMLAQAIQDANKEASRWSYSCACRPEVYIGPGREEAMADHRKLYFCDKCGEYFKRNI